MSSPSHIHVLDKSNYSKHHLIPLPQDAESPSPSPSLPPSSLRLRPRILGLTTNNLTYARFGHLMGWYDIYPLPPNTPAPYNDPEKYGRVAAWGYADIVESSVPGIDVGKSVYGFLPISSGTEIVKISIATHAGKEINDQILVLDQHRQHLWKIYNRYQICPPLPSLEEQKGKKSLGYDALMQGLFATGYNLSTYGFAWESAKRIHPSGAGPWTAQDADLHDAAIIVLNGSGKTALSFAHALTHTRPASSRPKIIIGVGSAKSVGAITASKLYDAVCNNSDYDCVNATLEATKSQRLVLLDFGARQGVAEQWAEYIRSSALCVPYTQVTIGGEVAPQDPEKAKKRLEMLGQSVMVNASLLREKGIEGGGDEYFTEFYEAWEGFKSGTGVGGMELRWGDGVEGWKDGWEALCRDEVAAGVGLVYRV